MHAGSITVVVPVSRGPGSVRALMEALAAQTLPAERFSASLAFDGVDPARYARALEPMEKRVRWTALPRGGPARARNAAADAQRGGWLVFTDDDCLPPPDWLERAAQGMDGSCDAFGGPAGAGPDAGVVERYLDAAGLMSPAAKDDPLAGLNTANLAVDSVWFRRIGGFDERFRFAGGEDADLLRRLRARGARLGLRPDWRMVHRHGAGPAAVCGRFFRYGRARVLDARLRGRKVETRGAREWLRALRCWARDSAAAAELAPPDARGERAAFRALALLQQLSFEAGALWESRVRA